MRAARAAMIAAFAIAPGLAAGQQDEGQAGGIGGIGLASCASVTGAENAPRLAEAADWALGYMAGRLDAGQKAGEEAALVTDQGADLATAILLHCAKETDSSVLAAMRAYASRAFGAEALGPTPPMLPDPPRSAPPQPDAADLTAAPDAEEGGDAPPPRNAAPATRPRPRPDRNSE